MGDNFLGGQNFCRAVEPSDEIVIKLLAPVSAPTLNQEKLTIFFSPRLFFPFEGFKS